MRTDAAPSPTGLLPPDAGRSDGLRMYGLAALYFTASLAASAALLFGGAGRIDRPYYWAYLTILFAQGLFLLRVIDRGLLRERLCPGPGGRDRRLPPVLGALYLAHLAVAGLDARLGWTSVPSAARGVGLLGAAAGLALTIWAMRANPYFSPVVRLQPERGHRLVTGGPYGIVRHPGYAGSLCLCACSGLALGSWWSMIPTGIAAALIVRRARLEDRFLRVNLAGYAAYARRVRWRLAPGLW